MPGVSADPAKAALDHLYGQILGQFGIVEDELVDDDRGIPPDRELGAVAEQELAEAIGRGPDTLVAMDGAFIARG